MTCTIGWGQGKQGIASAHRRLITDTPRRSACLDDDFKACDPNERRWDCVVERTSGAGAAIEVHSANLSDAKVMVAKKAWAVRTLAQHEPGLLVDAWHWIVPPHASFSFPPTSPAARLTVKEGIKLPRRNIGRGQL